MNFIVSDWVQGKTGEDELIHGFIETIDSSQGIVTIHVVKSDNKERIGHKVAVRASRIKQIPDNTSMNNQLAEDLIDLALATRDEAWFLKLTEGLRSEGQSTSRTERKIRLHAAHFNRLNKFV